jgi:hypothetical protein
MISGRTSSKRASQPTECWLLATAAQVRHCCLTDAAMALLNSSCMLYVAGLKQTGTGHFSPLAGYHAASDSVLIMDVARFKYPPHWVTVAQLWHAMADYVDSVTGKARGYVVLQRSALKPLLMFHFPALYTTSTPNNSGTASCCRVKAPAMTARRKAAVTRLPADAMASAYCWRWFGTASHP